MLAYTYKTKGTFKLEEKPVPEILSPTDAIVRVTLSSICTSDLHIKHGSVPRAVPGITVGHEMVGVVEKVGAAVTNVAPGDRVTVNVETFCGECFFCRNGWVNNCENENGGWALGCRIDGGQAEYVRVPLANQGLNRIPDSVTDRQALFVGDVLATGYWAAKISDIKEQDTVLIIGAGPTGIILAQLLRRAGAGRMVIADPHADKLDILRKYGFTDLVVMDKADPSKHTAEIKAIMPKGFDIVIDATGAASVFESCFHFVHMGSKIVAYGVCAADAKVPVSPYDIFSQEYTILGSFAQTHCFGRALEYLESGAVQVKELISHELPLEDYGKGLDYIVQKQARKVIIHP